MRDGSRLGQLFWDKDDPFGLRWGQLFWNQVKKKKESESWRKKERMRALVGTFLNEREKKEKKGEIKR